MIGGNKELIIEIVDNTNIEYDKLGKRIVKYKNIDTIKGYLDLISGDSNYNYNAKIEDSTHIFICDYKDLSLLDIEEIRGKIDNKIYDIKYIDNPMGLNEHLEIYLKFKGGQ